MNLEEPYDSQEFQSWSLKKFSGTSWTSVLVFRSVDSQQNLMFRCNKPINKITVGIPALGSDYFVRFMLTHTFLPFQEYLQNKFQGNKLVFHELPLCNPLSSMTLWLSFQDCKHEKLSHQLMLFMQYPALYQWWLLGKRLHADTSGGAVKWLVFPVEVCLHR